MPKPAHLTIPPSAGKRRCGAYLRKRRNKHLGRCYCKRVPSIGSDRCKFHGGLSTGAITPEGKRRSLAAMQEGRRRWLERKKIERETLALLRELGS